MDVQVIYKCYCQNNTNDNNNIIFYHRYYFIIIIILSLLLFYHRHILLLFYRCRIYYYFITCEFFTKMSSVLYTIGLVKTVTKTNETATGEVMFRLNEIEFNCLEFKMFNRSSDSLFRDVIKGCMYSFVGSFFFDIKIKVGFLLQMVNQIFLINDKLIMFSLILSIS